MKKPIMHPDLFEKRPTPIAKEPAGIFQKVKADIGFQRKIGRKGERCKNCVFATLFETGTKRVWKCKWIGFSNSEASDIRLYCHCRKFQKKELKPVSSD